MPFDSAATEAIRPTESAGLVSFDRQKDVWSIPHSFGSETGVRELCVARIAKELEIRGAIVRSRLITSFATVHRPQVQAESRS
jgi:hypothetical protein